MSRVEAIRSSSSDSDSSGGVWEEKSCPDFSSSEIIDSSSVTRLHRDDWMLGNCDDLESIGKPREKSVREKQKEIDRARMVWTQKRREISKEIPSDTASDAVACTSNAASRRSDGGASWLHRALRRAKDQAKEEGRSLEEVAALRWGSLTNLMQMIEKAEHKSSTSSSKREAAEPKTRSHSDRRSRKTDWRDTSRHNHNRSWKREELKRDEFGVRSKPEHHSPGGHQHAIASAENNRGISPKHHSRHGRLGDFHMEFSANTVEVGFNANGKQPQAKLVSAHCASKLKDGWVGKSFVPSDQPIVGNRSEPYYPEIDDQKMVKSTRPMTLVERNAVSAKLLKAEMLGKTTLIEKLRKQLELGVITTDTATSAAGADDISSGKETLIIQTDPRTGYSAPVNIDVEDGKDGEQRKRKGPTFAEQYASADASAPIRDLAESERSVSAVDQDVEFAKAVCRKGVTPQQLDSQDEMLADDVYMAKCPPPKKKLKEAEMSEAIRGHKSTQKIMDMCHSCMDTKRFSKHLVVSFRQNCYLSVPSAPQLVDDYLLITPNSHMASIRQLDEDIFDSVKELMRSVTNMFSAKGRDVVFMERAMHLAKLPHAELHCIPLDASAGELAPMYFQKAILEAEGEWLHNKRLIKFDFEEGLMKKIPKGMPYFSVQFGISGGFAHVIEREDTFPANFGIQVLGGILDLDAIQLREKRNENFHEQMKRCGRVKDEFKAHESE